MPVPGPHMMIGVAGSAGRRKWLVWMKARTGPCRTGAVGEEAACDAMAQPPAPRVAHHRDTEMHFARCDALR